MADQIFKIRSGDDIRNHGAVVGKPRGYNVLDSRVDSSLDILDIDDKFENRFRYGGGPLSIGTPLVWMDASRNVSTGGARQFVAASSERLIRADEPTFEIGAGFDWWISVFVYFDDNALTSVIVCKDDITDREWLLYLNRDGGGNTFTFRTIKGGSATTNVGVSEIGQWYHFFGWYRATDGRLRVKLNNGTTQTSLAISIPTDGAAAFSIGSLSQGSAGTTGRIARVGFGKPGTDLGDGSEGTRAHIMATRFYNSGTGLTWGEITSQERTNWGLTANNGVYYNLNEVSGDAIDQVNAKNLTDTNTVTSADGPGIGAAVENDLIQQWGGVLDKTFSQSTQSKRPLYVIDEGKFGLKFDGVDDVLSSVANIDTGVDRTVFIVARQHTSTANTQGVFSNASANWYVGVNTVDASFSSHFNSTPAQVTQGGSLDPFNPNRGVAMYRWLTSGVNVNTIHRVNDQTSMNTDRTDGHDEPVSRQFHIGTYSPTTLFAPIIVHEIVLYDYALTLKQELVVRKYLYSKWNINV